MLTYPTGERRTRASGALLPRPHQNISTIPMLSQQPRFNAFKEAQIQLAIQALKQDANLSVRRAAAIYRTSETTLRRRRAGRPSRVNIMPKSTNLDQNEETVIVEHILDLVARGFPPRLAAVADMANSLRAERNLAPVGTNWPSTFVKRHNELTTKFNRKYDYKELSARILGWYRAGSTW